MLKLKLGTKLIGGFMVTGLLLLIGGLVGSLGISQVSGDLKSFSENRLPGIHHLTVISKAQQTIGMIELSLVGLDPSRGGSSDNRLFTQLEEAWGNAEEARRRYDALPKEQQMAAQWDRLKPAWETWRQKDVELMRMVREGKHKEAAAFLMGSLGNSFDTVEALLSELSGTAMRVSEEARRNGLSQALRLKTTAIAGTAAGIIIAIAFGIFFSRSITGPVNRVITNLTETADQFAEAAGQIALSSNHLAEGTSIQADEVERTSRMIAEFKPLIRQCTEDIEALNKMRDKIAVIGWEAFEMLKQAKRAMREIKVASEKTVEIVKAIEKIAFQTNLLALNASVEAASAGEAGSGFSVVSEDVRNLGARSTDAVKKTIQLIDETIRVVNGGDQFVGTSMNKFIEYGTKSSPIADFAKTASDVAQDQMQGMEQINESIGQISKSAQANAASAQEAASVAEETSAQATSMKQIVKELAEVVGYRG